MSQPYIGEIRMFAGTFAPLGYFLCNGQLLSVNDYDTLYALIGTTYGGDGVNTFALPNLQGRLPVHRGTGTGQPTYVVGQLGGTETVTLLGNQIPSHSHPANCGGSAASASPANGLPGSISGSLYGPANSGPVVPMAPTMVGPSGNTQPHDNVMPFQAVNFIIAWQGTFPTQN